jgi:hypothetical protein
VPRPRTSRMSPAKFTAEAPRRRDAKKK